MATPRDGGEGGQQLKVLGAWPSPFVLRVRVALHLKGLDYENVEEDLVNKSELLLTSNPVHKKVPVLLHAGRPVPESLVILEYLDDAFPASGPVLLPADPFDRAIARFWAAYVDGKLHGAMVAALTGATEEARAAATEDTFAALDALEGALKKSSGGKGFFAGDAPGYLDVALGGFVGWLRAWDKITGVTLLDAGRVPLLTAWAERFAALDAAKGIIPEPEQLAEFAKVLQARAAAAAEGN
ncbi:unnamed protein product [Urochloa humidicola]